MASTDSRLMRRHALKDDTAEFLHTGRISMTPSGSAIATERLLLRGFEIEDAPRLAFLAGNRQISDTMISVPHPFSLEQAQSRIVGFLRDLATASGFHYAIALRNEPRNFIGYIALKDVDWEHEQAELSFWVDIQHAGQGYVTESGRALLDFAFDELELNRVCAYHMSRNPISGKVLARLGFTSEGCLRQRAKKWGRFEDACVWGKLRQDVRQPPN